MNERKPLTLNKLREMHAQGQPITMLTCYDACFARRLDAAGVDCPIGVPPHIYAFHCYTRNSIPLYRTLALQSQMQVPG